MSDHDVDRMMQRLRAIYAKEDGAEGSGLVPILAAVVGRLDGIGERLDSIDTRLDELTAEVSLQRAALERFGFMRKRPTPPAGGYGGGSGLTMAPKGE